MAASIFSNFTVPSLPLSFFLKKNYWVFSQSPELVQDNCYYFNPGLQDVQRSLSLVLGIKTNQNDQIRESKIIHPFGVFLTRNFYIRNVAYVPLNRRKESIIFFHLFKKQAPNLQKVLCQVLCMKYQIEQALFLFNKANGVVFFYLNM